MIEGTKAQCDFVGEQLQQVIPQLNKTRDPRFWKDTDKKLELTKWRLGDDWIINGHKFQ